MGNPAKKKTTQATLIYRKKMSPGNLRKKNYPGDIYPIEEDVAWELAKKTTQATYIL
jgi:hypothetical protein